MVKTMNTTAKTTIFSLTSGISSVGRACACQAYLKAFLLFAKRFLEPNSPLMPTPFPAIS